jgi:AcrR family transcriptional regulator
MQVETTEKRTKWQIKREASYLALVDSAMRQFHNRGYEKTRIEDILEGTRYTSGAFYFHFKNKADCFWHVIAYREELRGDWPTQILDGLDPATTGLEQVLGRVFAHFAAAESGASAWVLVMVDFYQQHRHDPEAQTKLADTYQRWRQGLARFVTALQRGGWVNPDRDPVLLATQIFAYTEGTITHTNLYKLDQPGLIDGLIRLLKESA